MIGQIKSALIFLYTTNSWILFVPPFVLGYLTAELYKRTLSHNKNHISELNREICHLKKEKKEIERRYALSVDKWSHLQEKNYNLEEKNIGLEKELACSYKTLKIYTETIMNNKERNNGRERNNAHPRSHRRNHGNEGRS